LSGPDVDEASSERVQIPQECVEVFEGKRSGPMTPVNAERERLDKKIHIRPPGAWLAATENRDEIDVTRSGHRTDKVPIRQRQVKVILRARRLGESNIELIEVRRKVKLASTHENHLPRQRHHRRRSSSRGSVEAKPQMQGQRQER
jgi:hypothetical protein